MLKLSAISDAEALKQFMCILLKPKFRKGEGIKESIIIKCVDKKKLKRRQHRRESEYMLSEIALGPIQWYLFRQKLHVFQNILVHSEKL